MMSKNGPAMDIVAASVSEWTNHHSLTLAATIDRKNSKSRGIGISGW